MMRTAAPILHLTGIRHSFHGRGHPVPVLTGVDLTVAAGERVAIVGPSGSGKSTLLAAASGVLRPDVGRVALDGTDLTRLNANARADLRLHKVAHVYQDFRLFERLSATENVAIPLRLKGVPAREANSRAADALTEAGMSHRLHHRPPELSGGERQRVAIARAVVSRPRLLLCDEPTGSLDTELRDGVLTLLLESAREAAVILVTHDAAVAARADRTLVLQSGRLTVSTGAGT